MLRLHHAALGIALDYFIFYLMKGFLKLIMNAYLYTIFHFTEIKLCKATKLT